MGRVSPEATRAVRGQRREVRHGRCAGRLCDDLVGVAADVSTQSLPAKIFQGLMFWGVPLF